MMAPLPEKLANLPEEIRKNLEKHRFHAQRFYEFAARLKSGTPLENHVAGVLEAPDYASIDELPARDSPAYQELEAVGTRALSAGQVALVVLAGGMATRMGGQV